MVDESARHRMYNAVHSLVGARPIKERLQTAAITLLPLQGRDFPEGPQRELFEEIHSRLTKLSGGPEEGDLGASIRGMDEEAAVEVAEGIVRLFYLVAFPESD